MYPKKIVRKDVWFDKTTIIYDDCVKKTIFINDTSRFKKHLNEIAKSCEMFSYIIPDEFYYNFNINGSEINITQDIASHDFKISYRDYVSFVKETYKKLRSKIQYPVISDFQPGNNIMWYRDNYVYIDECKIRVMDTYDNWYSQLHLETTILVFGKFKYQYFWDFDTCATYQRKLLHAIINACKTR